MASHKHRTSNKRRCCRKLDLAVDDDGSIVASRLNESTSDEAVTGAELVGGLRATIERFTADGAYDSRMLYEAVSAIDSHDLKFVIPPKAIPIIDFSGARGMASAERVDSSNRTGGPPSMAEGFRC